MENIITKILIAISAICFVIAISVWADYHYFSDTKEIKTVSFEEETNEMVRELYSEETVDLQALETEIYDQLYESFSEVEGWEVTRNGNNIYISVIE